MIACFLPSTISISSFNICLFIPKVNPSPEEYVTTVYCCCERYAHLEDAAAADKSLLVLVVQLILANEVDDCVVDALLVETRGMVELMGDTLRRMVHIRLVWVGRS